MANKLAVFFSDVKLEMKKVSWPTRDELIGSSAMVIIMTLCMAVFIAICDLIVSQALTILLR